jgi:uncharacterized membrane protein
MNATSILNIVLWSVQIFLALFFASAAIPKLSGRGIERWTGFAELPRAVVLFIGAMEVVGAIGLVVPMATGFLPWLTPLAAIGLAANVLMAAGFHLRADERLEATETTLWASIATAVAIGRWNLIGSHVDVAPWLLVAALAILVPAAITNVVILLRRAPRTATVRTPKQQSLSVSES